MEKLRLFCLTLALGIAAAFPAGRAQTPQPNAGTNLVFDATLKEYIPKADESTAEFDFSVTNVSKGPITITNVHASCGCTTPKLPPLPWVLAAGTNGSFHVTIDLHGKAGEFQKNVFIDTTEDGQKVLFLKVKMPDAGIGGVASGPDARTRNAMMAISNRQTVFQGECATCHKPSPEARGEKLFVDACAICHESDHRATSVPDLHALKNTPTRSYWESWVRFGKVGTMMPAFANEHEGPLTDPQVASLVEYLSKDFPNRPHKGATASALGIAPPPTGASAIAQPASH
jgi:mono/diheme cytochrome c family protein